MGDGVDVWKSEQGGQEDECDDEGSTSYSFIFLLLELSANKFGLLYDENEDGEISYLQLLIVTNLTMVPTLWIWNFRSWWRWWI